MRPKKRKSKVVGPRFSPDMTVGMAWYRQDDYPLARTIMTDRADLHETYGEWLSAAKDDESGLLANGIHIVRVLLDPPAFLAWCRSKGVDTVAASRSEYVAEMLRAGTATILPCSG